MIKFPGEEILKLRLDEGKTFLQVKRGDMILGKRNSIYESLSWNQIRHFSLFVPQIYLSGALSLF